jgi:hypothetical protein
VVFEAGRLFKGRLTLTERIATVADSHQPYGFKVEYANGTLNVLTAGVQNTAYLSFTYPNDHYIGVYPAGAPPLMLLEQPTRYMLNGDVDGYGWMERSVPGVIGID